MRQINIGQWETDDDEIITAPIRKLFRPYEHLDPPELTTQFFLTPVPEALAIYEIVCFEKPPDVDSLWATCPACKHRFAHPDEESCRPWVVALSPDHALEIARNIDDLSYQDEPRYVAGLANLADEGEGYVAPWTPWGLEDDDLVALIAPDGEMFYDFGALPQPPRDPGWLAVVRGPKEVKNWIAIAGPDPELEALKWPERKVVMR